MERFTGARRCIAFAAIAVVCCAHTLPAHAKSHGTHFLAELDAGAILSGDGGPAMSLSLGGGAKLKGFSPRFYLLGTFARSEYEATSYADTAPWAGDEAGSFADLALGPRVYVPIAGALRWFGEGLVGASYASATFFELGLPGPIAAGEWLTLAVVSTGLQWRFIDALAVGVRVALSFNEAGLAGVSRLAGVHDTARTLIAAGVTWHF